jgi:Raf kinase inhibitor-like YbhB/YbcL family protein
MRRARVIALAGVLALPLLGLVIPEAGRSAMAFELQSPAFAPGQDIPATHTCDGRDTSPALRWTTPPSGTRSFALIVDDPDAPVGTWVHWVLYRIPVTVRELPEGVAARETVPGAGTHGVNDFGTIGYGGPCPPRGPAHRYVFTLYALDAELSLPSGTTKAALLKAIEGHILGQAELMGRYRRKS